MNDFGYSGQIRVRASPDGPTLDELVRKRVFSLADSQCGKSRRRYLPAVTRSARVASSESWPVAQQSRSART
jgi:hypothetical protein